MKWAICLTSLTLLAVLAFGVPSTASGATDQTYRQAQIDRPVTVDSGQKLMTYGASIRFFGFAAYRFISAKDWSFGIQFIVRFQNTNAGPSSVQSPPGNPGWSVNPNLDDGGWTDTASGGASAKYGDHSIR